MTEAENEAPKGGQLFNWIPAAQNWVEPFHRAHAAKFCGGFSPRLIHLFDTVVLVGENSPPRDEA